MKSIRNILVLFVLGVSFYLLKPQYSIAWSPADVPLSYTLFANIPTYPYQMNFDNSGNLFVTSTGDDSTYKYNANGAYVTKFGTAFSGPTGVDIDSTGNVFVANYQQDKIEKYDNDGNFILDFGSTGSGNNQFSSPYAIAIDSSDNVYVADADNNRIQIFNNSLVYQNTINGNGAFSFPESIAIDDADNLYVLDSGNNRVQVFDSTGSFIRNVTGNGGDWNYPEGMTVDLDGNLFVADSGNYRIQVFNSSGVFQQEFGSAGVALGQFNYVTGLAINSLGVLLAGDMDRIQKVTFDRISAYVTIDSVPITNWLDTEVLVTGTATDTLGTIVSVEYRVDTGAYSACTSDDGVFDEIAEDYTCQVPIIGLSDGYHSIDIRTTDSHTNAVVNGSETYIDMNPPVISIDDFANNSTSDSTPVIIGVLSDSVSNILNVEYNLDGGLFNTFCSPTDGAFDEMIENFYCNIEELSEGSHTIGIRSNDVRPNENLFDTMEYYTIKVDLNPANLTIDSIASNNTTDKTPVITGSVTDSVTKIVNVQYKVDSGSYHSCTAVDGTFNELSEDFRCQISETLSVGSHTISIRSVDEVGNTNSGGNLDTYSFTVTEPVSLQNDESTVPPTDDSTETPTTDEETPQEPVVDTPDPEPIPTPEGESPRDFEGTNPISGFLNNVSQVTKYIQNVAKNFVPKLITLKTADIVQEGAIVTGLSSAIVFTPSVLSTFYFSSLQTLQNIFIFFGLKKKGRPYGYVYNSVTKSPLSLAIIRVFNMEGTLVTTAVTNTYGVFNLELESERYKITAVKGGYSFPSTIITGNTDGSISNVYDGNIVNIDQKSIEKLSIAMDPTDETVNGITLLGVKLSRFLSIFVSLLFVLGAIYSCYVVSVAPIPYNLFILSLYLVTAFAYLMSYLKSSKVGKVKLSDEPISGIQVALKLVDLDKVVDTRYTDDDGKYSFVATPGKYEIVVNDKRYEEVDYEQQIINIKGEKPEVIFRDFEISRAN